MAWLKRQLDQQVKTGEAREVHHFALLIGYGAAAINPYLAFDTIEQLVRENRTTITDFELAQKNYIKAVGMVLESKKQ